jgi:hypothetical protein
VKSGMHQCGVLQFFIGSCYDLIAYGSGIEHGASVQHVCIFSGNTLYC